MKTFTIRACALTLALAGATATTVSSSAHAKVPATHKLTAAMADPTSPAPMCLPSSGNYCGMD